MANKFTWTDDDLLEAFKKVLKDHPNVSANQYDRLNVADKPSRRTLETRLGKSWSQLLTLSGMEKSSKQYNSSSRKADSPSMFEDCSDNKVYFEMTAEKPITLEQALEARKVDLEKWKVVRYTTGQWPTNMKIRVKTGTDNKGEPILEDKPVTRINYQIKVWLEPKIITPIEIAIKNLISEIPKFKPPKIKRVIPETSFALELCLYDAHFGKLAWGKETMQGDYDLKLAGEWFLDAAEKNLNFTAPFNISKIFFVLGQDLMHAENFLAQTPISGYSLDVDSRLPKIYTEAKAALLKALYMCRQIAPVEILWIPGNHDMHASFYMSDVIKEHFRDDKFVEVDNSPSWKKARLWGNLLVGYTHDASGGKANVTVNMLPQFWPELWGKSKFREWHTGHKHKKNEVKFAPTTTLGGVIIRQIPTLSVIDAWHYQHGFVDAVPAGESFIWSKNNGICAHFTAHVGEDL